MSVPSAQPVLQLVLLLSASQPFPSDSNSSHSAFRSSQLLQDDSQEHEPQDATPQVISASRLQSFQTALGQLIDGPLFANDAADVEPLIAAVNARLRSSEERFADTEAALALQELHDRNRIMLSDGGIYRRSKLNITH